jgi:DMSO/TMAO reductase YedYZ molybdopterin-dependent catalytic subunit
MPLLIACLLVIGVMASAVACGGSDETTTTTAAAPATTAPSADGATGAGIEVKGLVERPQTLAAADLEAMNVTTITAEHPKKGATEYSGVLLSELMTAVGAQSGAATVTIAASDGYMAEIPLADLDADAMLAFDDDGTYDAVMPGMDGKSWVSDVVSMEFK